MTSKKVFWTSVIMVGTAVASWAAEAAGPDYLKVKDLTPVKVLATPQHPPVVLVADGRAKAKLYVAVEKPSEKLALLLKELVGTIKASTGAELESVKDLPGPDVPTIVIGDCEATRKAGIDAGAIPVEGFVVKTAPNRVYLVGSTQALPAASHKRENWANEGTAWAVADFLERFVGVRWYWPVQVGGRSILAAKSLSVSPAHYSDQPVFLKREFWPPKYVMGRMRARAGYKDDPIPGERAIPPELDAIDMTVLHACLRAGSSWPYQLNLHAPQQPWKNPKLAAQHPELFRLNKDGTRNRDMLCYSHPNTLAFLLAGCDAVWGNNKDAMAPWSNFYVSWVSSTSVTVSPWDDALDCRCEACQASFKDGGPAKHMARFVKKFAEEVQRRWSDKMVFYHPYWNYGKCPEGFVFPDNVIIWCPSGDMAGMSMPSQKSVVDKKLADWRQSSAHRIQTRDYCGGGTYCSFAPVQYPHVVKDYYARNRGRFVGAFINGESLNEWSKSAPTFYCWSKILWNPDLDVDAVLDVFCERMFGKAGKTARELLRLECDRWENVQVWPFAPGHLPNKHYLKIWPPEVVAEMVRLWEQARKELQDDPVALQRFEYFTWTFEYFQKEVQEVQASVKK